MGMGLQHQRIPMRFGQNTGGCYAAKASIAPNFTAVWGIVPGFESIPIHQNDSRLGQQLIQGAVHREDTCLQYVDFVNFTWAALPDGPGQGFGTNVLAAMISLGFG